MARGERVLDLLLWRHADAEDGAPDAARKLTQRGHEQASEAADWLRTHLPDQYRVLVSPAARAQQTAHALKPRHVETEPAVGVGATPAAVLRASGWPGSEGTVMVVGHQPTLGRVAALLLCGTEQDWVFGKSAVWWFSRRGGETLLRAVFNPKLD